MKSAKLMLVCGMGYSLVMSVLLVTEILYRMCWACACPTRSSSTTGISSICPKPGTSYSSQQYSIRSSWPHSWSPITGSTTTNPLVLQPSAPRRTCPCDLFILLRLLNLPSHSNIPTFTVSSFLFRFEIGCPVDCVISIIIYYQQCKANQNNSNPLATLLPSSVASTLLPN